MFCIKFILFLKCMFINNSFKIMPLGTAYIEETLQTRQDGVKRLLASLLNLNLQHESSEQCIINIINRFLSTAKHRKEGLEYLNLIINSCSSSVIIANSLNWVNQCIIKFPDDVLRELKLRVLGEIIEASYGETDFNKRFTSDYASRVLDNCLTTSHVNLAECKCALKTLTVGMKAYPSWFGLHRQKIESFVLIFLDGQDNELVQAAALAFHYLQQTGSPGNNGINHTTNFTNNFHKLCRTIHKLFDSFFQNEKEPFVFNASDEQTFEFPEDPTLNSQAVLHVINRRIHNVFKFIEIMIRTRYSGAKESKPKELLEVISRATTMHKCLGGDKEFTLENYQFSLLLLEIQCRALKLLRLFIIWYRSNSLPFSYSISKILISCLERSQNCECHNSNSLYLESTYRALSEWITVSKSSLHSQFQTNLIKCILNDITPVKAQITLTITEEAAAGKKSQKAKRKAMANRIIASGNYASNRRSTNSCETKACQYALDALKHLLECTKLNVKPDLLKVLYKSIFTPLIDIQSGKLIDLYSDQQCQAKLFEVLVAIYGQNTLSVLPPLHTALDILNRGVNNKSRFISRVCRQGLNKLESFCQPICPSLYIGESVDNGEEEVTPNVGESQNRMELDIDERSSVDFDASTDELLNHVTIPDDISEKEVSSQKSDQDTIPETTYHVRYTASDRSTIDDAHSDPGTYNEEFDVEEVDLETLASEPSSESKLRVCDKPVVTAPSEDGNEILDGEYQKINEEELEPILEEPELEDNEAIAEPDSQTGGDEVEATVSINNEEVSNNYEIDSEEPVSKKPRFEPSQDNESDTYVVDADNGENGETEVEKDVAEEDPDVSYLENDSFVDEVKDYY